jgi:hypothetical protein
MVGRPHRTNCVVCIQPDAGSDPIAHALPDACADVDANSCSDIDSYSLADRQTDACADIDSYALADRQTDACADVHVRACSACAISCPLWAHGHAFTSMHDDARARPRRQSSGHK